MVTHSWRWWYRFARKNLGLAEVEAYEYANRRALEDENRQLLEDRRAA